MGDDSPPPSPPCNTPNEVPEISISTLPVPLPHLPATVTLPTIREVGVRNAIFQLAEIFNLNPKNAVTFWYLDMLVDLLWRLQDEYLLPGDQQAVAVSWVIFFVDTLQDRQSHYTKETLFKHFEEMVSLAGEVMNEGDPCLPRAEDLAEHVTMNDILEMTDAAEDTSEVQYYDLRFGNKQYFYIIPKDAESTPNYASPNDSVTSLSISTEDEERKEVMEESESLLEMQENQQSALSSVTTMLAIIDFIFEYFYDDFQFSVLSTVLLRPPGVIVNNVGLYRVPKVPFEPEKPTEPEKPAEPEKSTKPEKSEKSKKSKIAIPEPKVEPSLTELVAKVVEENKKFIFPLKMAQVDESFWNECGITPPDK